MVATDVTVRYRINIGVSRFVVRVFATGLFSSFGHNPTLAVRDYEGEATFVAANPDQCSIQISAQAASLSVTDDVSQKDRTDIESKMNEDVLQTSRFPNIVFESTQVSINQLADNRYVANVTGNLSLHGATRRETITSQVYLDGDTIRANGEFSLRQTDYGIKPVSVAGGTLKVKDEVKISFDLSGRTVAARG